MDPPPAPTVGLVGGSPCVVSEDIAVVGGELGADLDPVSVRITAGRAGAVLQWNSDDLAHVVFLDSDGGATPILPRSREDAQPRAPEFAPLGSGFLSLERTHFTQQVTACTWSTDGREGPSVPVEVSRPVWLANTGVLALARDAVVVVAETGDSLTFIRARLAADGSLAIDTSDVPAVHQSGRLSSMALDRDGRWLAVFQTERGPNELIRERGGAIVLPRSVPVPGGQLEVVNGEVWVSWRSGTVGPRWDRARARFDSAAGELGEPVRATSAEMPIEPIARHDGPTLSFVRGGDGWIDEAVPISAAARLNASAVAWDGVHFVVAYATDETMRVARVRCPALETEIDGREP